MISRIRLRSRPASPPASDVARGGRPYERLSILRDQSLSLPFMPQREDSMTKSPSIKHVNVYVRNVERSKKWYEDCLASTSMIPAGWAPSDGR